MIRLQAVGNSSGVIIDRPILDLLNIKFHADQLRLFGGQDGIRDDGVLRSALATPEATFDGAYLHADEFMMAAAYAFHIAEGQYSLVSSRRISSSCSLKRTNQRRR